MLRVVIIGCGKIADGHVEQTRATGLADVVAVCDREPLMAEQLGVRMGVAACYSDFDVMLREQRPDVVHVATPPSSHLQIARTALAFGAHVFMEKPFTLDQVETRAVLECAARFRRRVSVNYLYNFESAALEARRMLDEGELGQIVHLETSYGYNLDGDYGVAVLRDSAHWVHRLPGRLFHNVLDHVLSKVAPFVGDDFTVSTVALRRRPPVGDPIVDVLDDELRFTIRSGCVTASGIISAHGRPLSHTLLMVGTRDTVELDVNARTVVRAAQQRYPSALGRILPAYTQARRYLHCVRRNLSEFRRGEFHYFHGMRTLLSRFYDAIAKDGPDPIPMTEIVRVSAMIDGIVRSMAVRAEANP